MLKPQPPLSGFLRSGRRKSARRCGVEGREGSAGLELKLIPDGREMLRCSVQWQARGGAMLKPHPPLSGVLRSGRRKLARRCGVCAGEGSAGLGLKLIPDGREILSRST